MKFRSFTTFVAALLLALLFRSFVAEPFHIPSGSMKGTLLIGDYIFVSKYTYGYSKFSIPFSLPLIEDRILFKQDVLKAGDVVVFRSPRDNSINLVKRVIGLPGDSIQIIGGFLYINGTKMAYKKAPDFVETNINGEKISISQYEETLYNKKQYMILDEIPNSSLDNTPLYIVPKDTFFVLGDNRDNSRDSRFISDVGFVPVQNIVGRVEFVALSFKKEKGGILPFSIRYDRLLKPIS